MKVKFNAGYALDFRTVLIGLRESLDADVPQGNLAHRLDQEARVQLFLMSHSVFKSFLESMYELSGRRNVSQEEQVKATLDLLWRKEVIYSDQIELLVDQYKTAVDLLADYVWLDPDEKELFGQSYAKIELYYDLMDEFLESLNEKGVPCD